MLQGHCSPIAAACAPLPLAACPMAPSRRRGAGSGRTCSPECCAGMLGGRPSLTLLTTCPCRTQTCRFSGLRIYPGKGVLYIRTDGQVCCRRHRS